MPLLGPTRDFARVAWQDWRRGELPVDSTNDHLEAALGWLARAHDVANRSGVSYGYSVRGGWLPPYRETSGYILATFFRAADHLSRPEYEERALEIADWLLTVQNDDGSFANPKYGQQGLVFDTGQCLFGLVAAYERSRDEKYVEGAMKAGTWLVDSLGREPAWQSHEYKGTAHTYNTRTAWALLRLNSIRPHQSYTETASRNLDWALANQQGNGLFSHNAFIAGGTPYTHNISYAICGLQESGWLLNDERYVRSARLCLDAVARHIRVDGFIPGQINNAGQSSARYSCLTGQAQLAIAWLRQHQSTGEGNLRTTAMKSLQFVKRHHRMAIAPSSMKGAVAGSYPVWGRYAPFSSPNWATKFFVDALLLEMSC